MTLVFDALISALEVVENKDIDKKISISARLNFVYEFIYEILPVICYNFNDIDTITTSQIYIIQANLIFFLILFKILNVKNSFSSF